MQRKKLLQLTVPPVPENDLEDTVQMTWNRWGREITKETPRILYTAEIDTHTGEQVLILDLYRPSGEHLFRMFTTKTQWFRKMPDGSLSEAGMDYLMEWMHILHEADVYAAPGAEDVIRTFTGDSRCPGLYAVAQIHKNAKKKRLEDKYQKILDKTYAGMQEIRPLPKAVRVWVRNSLMKKSRYLFADFGRGKTMTAVCSHCQKTVRIPHVRERSVAVCPNCRSRCLVLSKKRHERNAGFSQKRGFFYLQSTKDGFCERHFTVYWGFHPTQTQPHEVISENQRVFFEYNEAIDDYIRKGTAYVWDFFRGNHMDWCQRSAYHVREIRDRIYPGNLDAMFRKNKGFHAYHIRAGEIAETCGRLMPCLFYHAIENVKVLKNCVDAGLYRLAHDLIDMTQRTDRKKDEIVDNRYGSLRKALGIGKDDLAFLREADLKAGGLPLYRTLRAQKRPLEPRTFRRFCEDLYHKQQEKMLELPVSIYVQIRYLEKQMEHVENVKIMYGYSDAYRLQQTATYWLDYLENARLLQYDMTDRSVLMPIHLDYAHDAANEIVQSAKENNGYRFPQIEAQEAGYNRLYGIRGKTLLIRAPHNHQEIIDEGKNLHHCVAGYAKRVAAEETVILFVRQTDAPDTPYYTLEIDPIEHTMRQCRGLRNCGMTKDVETIVNRLIARLSGKKQTA